MSLFSRRRLQTMLDEVGPSLEPAKLREYISRIENTSTKDSMASEVELAVIWSLHKSTSKLDIEPVGTDGKSRVEATAHEMLPGRAPVAIEVRALSDDTMVGKSEMVRAASIMRDYCNRVRKDSGFRLTFYFGEVRERDGRWLIRSPHVSSNFSLTDDIKDILSAWICNEEWPKPTTLEIRTEKLTVNITARDFKVRRVSAHSTVPALIQHPEKNPIFRAIEKKAKKQLKHVPNDRLKCVILVDVGCQVLTDLDPISSTGSDIPPAEAIEHARNRFKVDLVIVMSAKMPVDRRMPAGWYNPIELTKHWAVTAFGDCGLLTQQNMEAIQRALAPLPPPRTDANLARQLYTQGAFAPQSTGNYLGSHFRGSMNSGEYEVKISARMLQEYLAGRIDKAAFERQSLSFGNGNIFENSLKNGMTISSVSLESAGQDEDDDWVCFRFSDDPSARRLKTTF